MRGLLFFIVGLFALFALLRAYTDVRSEKKIESNRSVIHEASMDSALPSESTVGP